MTLRINDMAPDFQAETTQGPIRFHEWLGDSWGVLFSHLKTSHRSAPPSWGTWPGCRRSLKKRNCKIIGSSVDPVADHSKWAMDIERSQGNKVNYPMVGDPDLESVAKPPGMLPAEAGDTFRWPDGGQQRHGPHRVHRRPG